MIYNPSNIDRMLGCLVKDTTLCVNTKYKLNKDDFMMQLHKVVFLTLHNLSVNGIKHPRLADIEEYLKNHQSAFNIYKDNDGADYINTIVKLADVKNYEYYYNQTKKFSCIRDYQANGFDIKQFWDVDSKDEDNIAKLDEVKVEDVIKYFEDKVNSLNRKYSIKQVKEEYLAGTDFMETKERFKELPLMGNSFQSECLNGIFRGMFGFIIRVAKSGGGKSVLSLGDLCKTCILEYWDYDKKKFIKNKSRVGNSLFINTELELREQLDVATIAWISGVERDHIIDGKYVDDEESRVDYASEVLMKSGMYFVDDPEFTTDTLIDTIKYYTSQYDVKTVMFDYISNNGFVAKQLSSETKVPQREDMVLLELTSRLKQVQRDTGCCLISACQTNGQEDSMEIPTSACMAGGKAQERKTDGVLIMLPPTKKELEQTTMLLAKVNNGKFGDGIKINNVCHIIKGRNSKYEKNIKIFQHVDLGTLRTTDLFCTNKYNVPINVEKLTIEYEI